LLQRFLGKFWLQFKASAVNGEIAMRSSKTIFSPLRSLGAGV